MCEWANDSHRFLLENFDTIHDSPSHIHHSALPLLPSSSWLHKYYGKEFSQEVRVVKGLPARWGTCSRTVFLGSPMRGISSWNNNIAVGFADGDIVILDAITGNQTATFSGHTDEVNSVVLSSDGQSLISGSDDATVKLWDVQTGGVVKTFIGHTSLVLSVSVSVDHTTIASGSQDKTIRLWGIQTKECHHVIRQSDVVHLVSFSPTDPQYFLSLSGGSVSQWNINGHQIGFTFYSSHAVFSPDGTQVASHYQTTATIRNTSSGEIVAKFHIAPNEFNRYLCFSPSGRLVVATVGSTAYVWDITSSEPHLIETSVGHSGAIISCIFPSPFSFISISHDRTIKFWQIQAPSIDLVKTDSESTSLTSTIIMSITLHIEHGITITSDLDGVVRIWDISTGLCKSSFQTPAKGTNKRDVQMANDILVLVWYADRKIKIWDIEKEKLLFLVDRPEGLEDLKISGDGSKVFLLDERSIKAWSMQTGKPVGTAEIVSDKHSSGALTIDGSKVWVHNSRAKDRVWDFGTLDSSPVELPNKPLSRPHPDGTILWDSGLSGIKEKATGKVIFKLSKRYGRPVNVQWNGQHLVACFMAGEVLTLDFSHMIF